MEGNPTSLVEDQEAMARVKRAVDGRNRKNKAAGKKGHRGPRMPQIVRRKPQRAPRRNRKRVARRG